MRCHSACYIIHQPPSFVLSSTCSDVTASVSACQTDLAAFASFSVSLAWLPLPGCHRKASSDPGGHRVKWGHEPCNLCGAPVTAGILVAHSMRKEAALNQNVIGLVRQESKHRPRMPTMSGCSLISIPPSVFRTFSAPF